MCVCVCERDATSLLIDRKVQFFPCRPQLKCIVGVSVGEVLLLEKRDFGLEAPAHIDLPASDDQTIKL